MTTAIFPAYILPLAERFHRAQKYDATTIVSLQNAANITSSLNKMDKNEALANLVSQRRQENDSRYHHLKYFDDGFYDCDFVVPWTISGCNLDSNLMILAQDWASENFLKKRSKPTQKELRKLHGQDADLPTNKNLKALLKKHFDLEFSDVYATDVFVFIKPGHMSAPIPIGDLEYSAKRYTLREIEIVQPRMVLCLGAIQWATWRAWST
jgi:uracil-DNA glycosylase